MKALHQNGYEQVEEDIVAEGHEGNKIEGSQRRGGGHPVIEHRVPVLLGEDLQRGREMEEEVTSNTKWTRNAAFIGISCSEHNNENSKSVFFL